MQHFVIAILFLIQTWTCKYFYIKSAWYVSTHTRTVILSLGYSYVTFPRKSWASYECGSENSSNSVQALLKIFIKKLKKICEKLKKRDTVKPPNRKNKSRELKFYLLGLLTRSIWTHKIYLPKIWQVTGMARKHFPNIEWLPGFRASMLSDLAVNFPIYHTVLWHSLIIKISATLLHGRLWGNQKIK